MSSDNKLDKQRLPLPWLSWSQRPSSGGMWYRPVVLVSGVLPLGAAVALFNAIIALMKVSRLEGDALSGAWVALSANTGKVFTTSLAIALGLATGMAIVRLFRREEVREGV